METLEIIVYLLIGVALGGVIGWLIGSRKGARAEAESQATEQRFEDHRRQSEEQHAALRESFKVLSADALKEARNWCAWPARRLASCTRAPRAN